MEEAPVLESARKAQEEIAKERERLYAKAKAEVEEEDKKKFAANDRQVAEDRRIHAEHIASRRRIEKELDDMHKGTHLDPNRKIDDTIDRLIGPRKGKAKVQRKPRQKPEQRLVRPEEIGTIVQEPKKRSILTIVPHD